MINSSRFIIRTLAFLRKEIVEVVRQPLLVLTLILGPFLILLFFGIGYRNEPRPLRTLIVSDDEGLRKKIEQYASTLGAQLIFAGITDDLEEARAQLRRGEIDLVTVVPVNAYQTILGNQQAVIELYHDEIDPLQRDYINVFGRVYVDEINRRILRLITSQGQVDLSQIQENLETAQESAIALRELLEDCTQTLDRLDEEGQCDRDTAQTYLLDIDRNVTDLDSALEDNERLNDAIQQALSDSPSGHTTNRDSPRLAEILNNTNELSELGDSVDDYLANLQTLLELEHDLDAVEARLNEFINIDPQVLVSPFRSEARTIATIVPGITDFFAPSVIVLLLQHLAITFAALSMVREKQLGTMELFYVSPLSALEALLGKYLSYLVFGGIIATVLLMLVVYGLGVPVLGSWIGVGLVIAALLFSAMGIGFAISLISKTDIQAVQYSMIVLLTSVFFSGFFLSLDALWEPVRAISWSLPATYGILLMRSIMLRGAPLSLDQFAQLILIGLALFLLAWLLLRRSMAYS